MIAAIRSYAWLLITVALVAALATSYMAGKRHSTAIWQAKYDSREAELHKQYAEEIKRQADANQAAQRISAEIIDRLQRERSDLQGQIDELEREAQADPDANSLGINSNAAKRIGSVK